ncbi:MAG: hypothetical protein L3J34_05705 [Flavobacteriaceae bacterium]|nr:hypothetical protein [Flavobacteriaceae bacterium]
MINLLKLTTVFFVLILFSCKQEEKKVDTIQFIESPANGISKQPYLFSNGNDVLMSWTQKVNDSTHTLNYSSLMDGKWTVSQEIAKGENWFINWADFPAIAKNNDNIITHFLQKSDSATFAYDVRIKQTMDNGAVWMDDQKVHKDSTLTEHGFATILPYKDGGFFMTWLDGRNTKGDEGHGGHGGSDAKSGATKSNKKSPSENKAIVAMNIRTATVLPNGEVIDDILVDNKTCDCCQTSAAITPNGPIIVYRDRSDEEVRDIYISRLVEGNWTEPKTIHNDNWVIKGCPVNGPKADTFDNTLVIAWFTAADNVPKVNLTFSDDNGENFALPIQIDNGKPIGRVDVAIIDDKNVLVSWMETTENGADIKIIKVNKNGTKSKPFVISSLSESRASGFPQIELVNGNIIAAWNHVVDKKSTIKTASFSLDVFNM